MPNTVTNEEKNVFFYNSATVIRQKFYKLGFREDVRTQNFVIYRNSNYPFQRVVLPIQGRVSTIAIKMMLEAIGENYNTFLEL